MSSSDPTKPAPDDVPADEGFVAPAAQRASNQTSSEEDAPASADALEPAGVPLGSHEEFDVDEMYPPGSTAVLVHEDGPSLFARLGVELLGSFGLVLAGVGVALYSSFTGAGPLGVALAFGLALLALLAAFGSISAHFNPAVTLGSALAGRTRWVDVVPYVLAQVAGAALAVTTLVVALRTVPTVTPDIFDQILGGASNGFGELSPFVAIAGGGFNIVAAILVEVVVTGVFVAIFLGVGRSALAAPAIGLAYAVGVLVAMPVTNGSLNPVRSTATAIFAGGEFVSQLWVFWAAPLLGAAIAGLVFGLVRPVDDEVVLEEVEETVEESEVVEVEPRP